MKKNKLFSLIGMMLTSSFAFGEETDNVNAWKADLINQVQQESSYNGVGFSNPKSAVAVTQQINALIKRIQEGLLTDEQIGVLVRNAKAYVDTCRQFPPSIVKDFISDNFFLQFSVWPKVELVEKLFNTAYEILSSNPDFNGYKFWQTPGYEED